MAADDRPVRRLWVYLLGLAAVGVVALSWMAPEPPSPADTRHRYESVSYSQCAPLDLAPPSYGTRSVSDTTSGGAAVGVTQCVR